MYKGHCDLFVNLLQCSVRVKPVQGYIDFLLSMEATFGSKLTRQLLTIPSLISQSTLSVYIQWLGKSVVMNWNALIRNFNVKFWVKVFALYLALFNRFLNISSV